MAYCLSQIQVAPGLPGWVKFMCQGPLLTLGENYTIANVCNKIVVNGTTSVPAARISFLTQCNVLLANHSVAYAATDIQQVTSDYYSVMASNCSAYATDEMIASCKFNPTTTGLFSTAIITTTQKSAITTGVANYSIASATTTSVGYLFTSKTIVSNYTTGSVSSQLASGDTSSKPSYSTLHELYRNPDTDKLIICEFGDSLVINYIGVKYPDVYILTCIVIFFIIVSIDELQDYNHGGANNCYDYNVILHNNIVDRFFNHQVNDNHVDHSDIDYDEAYISFHFHFNINVDINFDLYINNDRKQKY
ncbi:hypothetical protein HDU84_008774 [Entophlyctis sp. JEL0112]|nr:hypothetical protein HDU84_008774 [Entophlyctis sp. JEL0112]